MRKKHAAFGLMTGALLFAQPASATVFSDDLTKCVVNAANVQDRTQIMQWLFSAIAANAALAPMAKVSAPERLNYDKQFVAISERLLLTDCRPQLISALKNEGPGVIEATFRVLGEVAMRGLMSDPETAKSFNAVEAHSSKDKWEAAAKEADLTVPSAP
jgi:hypothetical protein